MPVIYSCLFAYITVNVVYGVISILNFENHSLLFFKLMLIGVIIFLLNFNINELFLAHSANYLLISEEKSEFAPFLWMVIIVGGSIMITLSYVSWRKYKGIVKNQRKKNSNS